jgi:regulator of RNase E activity RraA
LAYTVQYEAVTEASGFRNAANYIDDVPSGAIIVSCNDGREDCTTWGDILTHVAISRAIAGTLIDGAARDIEIVRQHRYPLYARAVFMRSGKNRVQLKAVQVPVDIAGVPIRPGDLIVADANGCVVLPHEQALEVIARAQAVEATERRIIAAVNAGARLADARQTLRYDQPWLPSEAADTRGG